MVIGDGLHECFACDHLQGARADSDAIGLRQNEIARCEGARTGRGVGQRDADFRQAARLIHFGGNHPHRARAILLCAGEANARRQPRRHPRDGLFGNIRLKVEIATDNDAKQRFAGAAGDRAKARRATADDAIDRRFNIGAVQPHHKFATLRRAAGLVGLRRSQRALPSGQLRLRHALRRDALIQGSFRNDLRAEPLRALEIGAGLHQGRLELFDLTGRLSNGGVGALHRGVALRRQRVELRAVEASQDLALRHMIALFSEDFGQPQPFERRADHRLFARHYRAGHK